MERVIACNKWERSISGAPYGIKSRVQLVVIGKLYVLGSNEYPYFSITGTVTRNDKRFRDPVIECGCIHETILQHFPHLAPLVSVHLSAPDGVPMHAEANARYWAGLSTWQDGRPMSPRDNYGRVEIETDSNGLEWSPVMLAQHLRVGVPLAREIRGAMVQGLTWQRITEHAHLNDLWSTEAAIARRLLESSEVA
jgi:hypothetical protein